LALFRCTFPLAVNFCINKRLRRHLFSTEIT